MAINSPSLLSCRVWVFHSNQCFFTITRNRSFEGWGKGVFFAGGLQRKSCIMLRVVPQDPSTAVPFIQKGMHGLNLA